MAIYATRAAIGLWALLAGCHDEHWLTYPWDDRRIVCSQTIDDLTEDAPWNLVEDQMAVAERTGAVLTLHAHAPGVTISTEAIARVLHRAEEHHLEFLTYRDLSPDATPRAGLALAFDDNAIDAWYGIRDLLRENGARVTFFVTRWYSRSDGERAELAELAADGHDVEPHSVHHLHAATYVLQHGLAAYLANEALPSIDGLTQAGYPPPTVYAFPFGEDSIAIDDAMFEHVPRLRVSPGSCPY